MKSAGFVVLGLALLSTALAHDAHAASGPSFDCTKARSAIERIICADPKLSAGDRAVDRDYRAALSQLSAEGRGSLRDGQRQWLAMIATICAPAKPDDRTIADDAKTCLATEYSERDTRLRDVVRRIGGFTFRRVDIYRARKSGDASDDGGVHGGFATANLSFPVIDAPKNEAERAFNRYMTKTADGQRDDDDDTTDQYLSFDAIAATARLISVETTSGFYGHGTPHGQYASQVVHWLLPEGRLMTAADVFAQNPAWKTVLRDRCFAGVAHYGFVKSKDDLKDMAAEPDRWWFGPQGLTVSFSIYEVASYADGEPTVLIPWSAIRAYLAPNAPVPSR